MTRTRYRKNLKGKLLLIHGEIDNNVHPANTIRVVNALIKANKRFDMLILPTQRHGFGDMNEYWFWRTADYFSKYLLGDQSERPVDIEELNREIERKDKRYLKINPAFLSQQGWQECIFQFSQTGW